MNCTGMSELLIHLSFSIPRGLMKKYLSIKGESYFHFKSEILDLTNRNSLDWNFIENFLRRRKVNERTVIMISHSQTL